MLIRLVTDADEENLWHIIKPIIRAGETYALPRDMSQAAALDYWRAPHRETFVAEEDGQIVGGYFMGANHLGGGSHVANCGFATAPALTGRGIATALCEHALNHARTAGFRAMQFNFVISTNERAVRLWQRFGFEIMARLPEAFNHPSLGFVDVFIMRRML
jgi:ribosomal protein S18 acetylase RimI-like enzyme